METGDTRRPNDLCAVEKNERTAFHVPFGSGQRIKCLGVAVRRIHDERLAGAIRTDREELPRGAIPGGDAWRRC
jgi:hypothetical protein